MKHNELGFRNKQAAESGGVNLFLANCDYISVPWRKCMDAYTRQCN